ncbi:hypothetical protein KTE26_14285 [Ralstonia mannitolilytica]|uniref:hypothetical protein n=1 Tax=Ralstonia mannitolilytica TaxID=105219 RepID=UPI001C21EF4F|nr:hypothetical protein [Ralstonia mannitolilytica]MBU9579599.1 hypothetical protein [Ralstonia mannitolilytica]
MTDDEARAALKDRSVTWIEWDQQKNAPCWACDFVVLEGAFTKEQLLAILYFADRAK